MPYDLDAIKRHHRAILGDDGAVSIKATTIKAPAIDRGNRLVKGSVSTTAKDMDREVVVPEGFVFDYFPNAVRAVYLNHDYDSLPVGTNVNLSVKGGALFAVTHITQRAIGDDLLTAMEEGAVNGFSVGFKTIDGGPPSDDERKRYGECDRVIRKALLIEYSITPMPCNPQALVELVSKSLIHRSSAEAFGMPMEAKSYAVRAPRKAVVAGGTIWTRAG